MPNRRLDRGRLGKTWRHCGGRRAQRWRQAPSACIGRHGPAPRLVCYLDPLEAVHPLQRHFALARPAWAVPLPVVLGLA